MASTVSLCVLNVDKVEEADDHDHKLFIETPEKPSPVSILDLPFLDQPPSKSSTSTGDEQSLEEEEEEEVSLVGITCMGDEEFKRVYDQVRINGNIPDDLKLLFDCVNEALKAECVIKDSRFPSMEKLVEHVLKRTKCDLDGELPRTLVQIVKSDLDLGSMYWKTTDVLSRSGIEATGGDVGDEILEDILDETVLELLPKD